MARRLPYTEGDWFAVPLKDYGFALGVIARASKRGKVVFGYFFGPKHPSLPALSDVEHLVSRDAIMSGRFGDLGLYDGSWKILGKRSIWDRNEWPMPRFCRREELTKKLFVVEYDDQDPLLRKSEKLTSDTECKDLLPDGVDGAGAVEIGLTHLLSEKNSNDT